MDVQKLIYETIMYGNPFDAIELNFFSYQELTDYLASNLTDIPKEKLYLAFTALLRLYPPEYLYSLGKHIMWYMPSDDLFFQNIYVILGGSPELPISKDDSSNTLWSLVFDVYSDYINDVYNETTEKAMLLCNKITVKLSKNEILDKSDQFIKSLYEYRCDKVISLLPKCGVRLKDTFPFAIDTDWFEMYPVLKNYYINYIDRVDYIRTTAPIYYSKMLESYLAQLCNLTLKDFEQLDFSLLQKTCHCFPQQFTDIDIPETYQRMCIYPLSVRAYLLGLSCYPKIPSKKKIDEALLLLSKIGIEEYVNHILNSQEKEEICSDLIANTEDTLYEKPEDYLSMDRFNIEENGKIYQFTRPEFKKLYSDKRNFWTKQPLSYSDLYSLQLRIQITHTLILPSSDTYKVLLEKACKGTLYEEPLHTSKNSQTYQSSLTNVSSDSSSEQYQQYLASMFQVLLNNIPHSE